MQGKYFDEFSVDDVFVTPGRTITETDVVMFAAMTGDYNQLHTNKEYMKHSQFGQRLVHGLLGLSISHGLLFRLGILEGTAIAFLAIDSWQFKAPLFFNDTIRVRVRVTEARASKSKPDRGIVTFFTEVLNQNDTVVQSGYQRLMMKRRVPADG
ncbi:MAG: dehydratase [Deltaproteobacteria bacterium]|nr:dehydratase [Deltaproteobacteria bacterium]MBW1961166.1 dehydratase [Deltaproteobacteria bacterium]MBW1996276.1 dehydratase [Deltaproteobacteria bacterium]MBW2150266.1 dehydratase [Deltaproteobacteria bacterium]